MNFNNGFETRRLIIRQFIEEDVLAIHELKSNPQFMKYLQVRSAIEETMAWVKIVSNFWQFNAGFWAVVLKETNETIGWCGTWTQLEFPMGEMEIGYAISPRYAGQGLATETARIALNYTFQIRKAIKVNAVAHPENYASHRIMEKLGMRRTGQMFFPSYNMEMVYYSISLDEYQQIYSS